MEFKNVLITGIGGSAGSYLAEYIVENHPEVKVSGIVRWHTEPSLKNLQDSRILSTNVVLPWST